MVAPWPASGEEPPAAETAGQTDAQQSTAGTIPPWIGDLPPSDSGPVPVPPNRTTTTTTTVAPPPPATTPPVSPAPSSPPSADGGGGASPAAADPDPPPAATPDGAPTFDPPAFDGSDPHAPTPEELEARIRAGLADPASPDGAAGEGEAASLENFVYNLPRSGASNTGVLLEVLRPLQDLGYTPEDIALMGFGRFPLAGPAHWTDDWLMPRSGPPVHLHQGNDIFAAFDTPVRAPASGILRLAQGGLGGNAAYVTEPDGTYYYLAHLNSFAADLASGMSVSQGQVVGFNGDSGNARGGAPHVHFEIHPQGGEAVNPKLVLDGWVSDAITAAPDLIAALRPEQPRVVAATALSRHLDGGLFAGPLRQPMTPLLWASSVSPTGSALRLAEASVTRLAGTLDWNGRMGAESARLTAWRETELAVRRTLFPLTPPLLTHALDAGPVDTSGAG